MEKLPDGVVTFLFTDVEGSTRLWEDAPDSMMEALRLHDGVITTAVETHNGLAVKPRGEGDSQFVVFGSAVDAVKGSAEMQRRLAEVDWPTPRPLRVRAALHTGMAELESGDYYGSAVNRAARLRAIAHGGQSVMSASTFELAQDHLPDGVTVTDMGAQRLKDLTRPEHVFQLNVDGLIDTFPALKSLDSVANNLPEQLTELIGRETELAETERLLGETRMLTILAPGGTGKTRLAIQAAADRTADYPDGVFWIALADISSTGDIVQAVAKAVGVALSSSEDSQDQLLEYLAPRRQLLVFDNFEHLSDGAMIVSAILRTAPDITVISTSRSKLGLSGEAVMSLGGLDTNWDSPEGLLQTSGARLFLDAAKRTRPGFLPGAEDIEPLGEILRLTEGMPLAILLAAAWVDVLSISDIAAEIAKSLDFLETTVTDASDRHRSLGAVFAYSWQLLSRDEQDTFAGLSVFRGGFTKEAAGAVTGASLRDLANLANKSLVTPNPDTGRYSVHELLRQYAEAELADQSDRYKETRQAHADYYADLTQQAFAMFALGEQNRMLATIESDLDNVRPAWRYHLATSNADGVRKMVRCLWIVYEIRGWYQGLLTLFNEALGVFEQDGDGSAAVAQAEILAIHGATLALLGQSEVGLASVATGVALMRESGDPEELFFALQLEAQTLIYVGRFDEVSTSVDEAIALGEEPASDWAQRHFWAAGFKNLGAFLALATGDTDRAVTLLDESREVMEPIEELYYMSWNLGHRARLALKEKRPDEAIDLFSQSADRARQLGFLRGLQVSLAALGEVSLATGDLIAARTAFIQSLDAAERMSMVPEMLGALANLGRVSAAEGRPKEAVELLATVVAEPMSNRQLFTESTSINAMASVELERLQDVVDRREWEEAHSAGSSEDYRVVAKELIDAIS
jgi:predicted ATPase/class 3 adenylate cyclase